MADDVDANMLRKIAGAPIGRFRGEPWYNPSGDCLIWHYHNEESYGERIDDKLTVYKSFGSDEIVGCQVKGVQTLLRKLGSFNVEFHANGISVALLFYISHFDALETSEDIRQRKPVYDRLMKRAGNTTFTIPDDTIPVCV